jgi:hypothetical protein
MQSYQWFATAVATMLHRNSLGIAKRNFSVRAPSKERNHMVAVTYATASVAAPSVEGASKSKKGFFARLLAAIEQSQLQRAERDLARYYHLLPLDHELRSGAFVSRSQAELPFIGR